MFVYMERFSHKIAQSEVGAQEIFFIFVVTYLIEEFFRKMKEMLKDITPTETQKSLTGVLRIILI